jgi:hypothetical protein
MEITIYNNSMSIESHTEKSMNLVVFGGFGSGGFGSGDLGCGFDSYYTLINYS